ncbi:hypothetical protein [Paenirhodobacter sp.]|uniref:hypothetical protein n=1 Tax=Paenirhodobacter sp. TaxID=1965326 RepID=UPI003B50CD69
MLIIAGVLAGVVLGVRQARARGGDRRDQAQHAAVQGIILGLCGLLLTIILNRMG